MQILKPFLIFCIMICAASQAKAQFEEFGKTNPQHEIEVGRQAAHEIDQPSRRSMNQADQERVRRIGNALIEKLPQKAYSYEFKVLADSDFNAFCLPGGFMFVYEGLLTKLPDDNAVAFVMAHEITHAAHRHWAHHIEKMKGFSIGALVLQAVTGSAEIGSLVSGLTSLKFSRADEDDADKSGLELAWTAGFDTKGGLEAAQVMADMEKGSHAPEYLRDHPAAKDRLSRLVNQAAQLALRTRPSTNSPDKNANIDIATVVGDLPAVRTADNRWFPLSPGNEWTYQVSGGTSGKASYTFRVVSVMKVNNGNVYRAETVLGKGSTVPCQLMTTAGNIWRRNRPTSSGSRWQVEYSVSMQEEQSITHGDATFSLQPTEPITVPCGAFTNVLKVRKAGNGNTLDLWFAQGIGLVKRACVETGVTETLASYKLASPSVAPLGN